MGVCFPATTLARVTMLASTASCHSYLENMLHRLELGAQVFGLLCVLSKKFVCEALFGDKHGLESKPLGCGVSNFAPKFCSKARTALRYQHKLLPVGPTVHTALYTVVHLRNHRRWHTKSVLCDNATATYQRTERRVHAKATQRTYREQSRVRSELC